MNILEKKDSYKVCGRYTVHDDVLYLAYSAAFVEFKFKGRKAVATIKSEEPSEEGMNCQIAIFVNDFDVPKKRIKLEGGEHEYVLTDFPKEQECSIRIMRYSETVYSYCGIVSIDIDGECRNVYPEKSKPKILFIGDSITCGYGNEGAFGEVFTTATENPWEAYACLTARKLNADFELLCWSGNGIISHYVDESINEPRNDEPLMPYLYPYADTVLEDKLGIKTYTLWKNEYKPDIVVVNLGTNDCSYCRGIEERNEVFKAEYEKFLITLREDNPNSEIVCMLGIMDDRLNACVKCVVEKRKDEKDNRICFLECPMQASEDGLGIDYHPTMVTHRKVSELLSNTLKQKM